MTEESQNTLLEVRRLYELWSMGELASEDLVFELGDVLGADADAPPGDSVAYRPRLVSA
jgi:hypothetical protein